MSIVVTGGSGLVGRYLKSIMPDAIYLSSKDYNLCNENEIKKLFNDLNPHTIIHLAARVGGIIDNIKYSADYYTENILMNTLLIKHAHLNNVQRFIGILSTCIYPDTVDTYPISEKDLHSGPPTSTNFSYGISKRGMAVQIDSYNEQYGTKYNYIIPCNLYGISDKDDEEKSHFVTALIKKIYEANINNEKSIILYGDGTPIRQFMYAEDLAKIIKMCIEKNITDSFNVATPEIYTIDEIAKIALAATNSSHLKIIYDKDKPNGQYRKDTAIDKMKNIFPDFEFKKLTDGIEIVYRSLL